MTGPEFTDAWAAAGAAYAAALSNLQAAYIELAAFDLAAENGAVIAQIGNRDRVRSFVAPHNLPHGDLQLALQHPIYAPNDGPDRWGDAVRVRAEQLAATIS